MEIAIVVLIIGLVFYLVSKRFQGFVRNTFYLDAINTDILNKCKEGDIVIVSGMNQRGKLIVEKEGTILGLVPEDYTKLIKRHIPDEGNLKGNIIRCDANMCKVSFNIKGEARDMIGE